MILAAIANHLWQSTLVAAIIGLATAAFRRNRASVRYGLWLAASIKFVVPFAILTAIGGHFGWRTATPVIRHQVSVLVDSVGQPFAGAAVNPMARPAIGAPRALGLGWSAVASAVWLAGFLVVLAGWWLQLRRTAVVIRGSVAAAEQRVVDALRRIERAVGIAPIRIVSCDTPMEPGVFGIVHPVLVWPQSIGEHFTDDEIAAILMHEVEHVRRHDNLAAVAHMIVEALFWFHPLVWWIGGRLVDERERACDEAVLGSGHEPRTYADTILRTCRLYLESPLLCVAGVTGSDLKHRIEGIMRTPSVQCLTKSKKLLLGLLATAPIGVPIVIGAVTTTRTHTDATITEAYLASYQASTTQAPVEFEVASVKPNKTGDGRVMIGGQPGGRFTATNVPLRLLIRNAYQLQDFQIVGGPDWVSSDRFDIVAKAGDQGDAVRAEPRGQPSRGQLMLRALLADRFKLQVHNEEREMPIFALVVARSDGKLGPQLQMSTVDCTALMANGRDRGQTPPGGPAQTGDRMPCGIRIAPGRMSVGGSTLAQFAGTLGAFVGRVVVDKTALTGTYDFNLTWTPDQIANRPPGAAEPLVNGVPIDPNGPSIYTAVQEQLGLKLESQKGPVSVLVIDRVEHPTPN